MLSRLTGQTIALIVVGVTILVALLWYFTMYQNTLAEQDVLKTEIADLEQKIEVGNRAKANVATLCTTVVDLRAQRREFLRALPSSEKFADILRILKTQVGNNGGQINSLTRTAGASNSQQPLPAGIRAVNTNIATEGPFTALTGTLQSLEGQQRFLRLDNINVAIVTNNQDEAPKPTGPDLNSQISVIAYVYDGARENQEQPLDAICSQFVTQPDQPTTPTSEVPR